jgi:ATP/maltotriose-dependent transcriptional regulator MalT
MATQPPVGAQEVPLLLTKLCIPPPRPDAQRVPRPRLIGRLNAGTLSGRKLTLISAPAGFGKTTLVSEWVHTMSAAPPPVAVAWLSLDEGDNDLTRFLVYLVADGEPTLPQQPDYFALIEYIVLARILIAQEQWDEATSLLRQLLNAARAGSRTSRVIEILAFLALALQALGDTPQAIAALQRALTLAEPEGYIRIFVDEGPPMACLLYQALTRGIRPDYVLRLLAAFPVPEPEAATPSVVHRPSAALVEPLSERELEVLQLIAGGLTNREIASRLFLSLNTVKAHTRNTYGKLDVHTRTEAAARARALGLISST